MWAVLRSCFDGPVQIAFATVSRLHFHSSRLARTSPCSRALRSSLTIASTSVLKSSNVSLLFHGNILYDHVSSPHMKLSYGPCQMGRWADCGTGTLTSCGENLLRLLHLCSTQIAVGQSAVQRTTLTPTLVEVNR
jgi:hypothetical protein